MSYLAQVANQAIPDLEHLERIYRREKQHWMADQVAMRIKMLKTAITESKKHEPIPAT